MHRLLTTCHPSEPFASPGGEPRRMKDDEASMNSGTERTRRHYRSQDSAKVVRSDPRSADRDPSRLGQLECNRKCGDWSAARVNRTSQLDGVALTARNSHQIYTRLQQLCRAADDNRQRDLAKECVGSNRGRKERLRLPAATTTQLNQTELSTDKTNMHRKTK